MLYARCLPRSRGVPTSFYSLTMMLSTNGGTPQYYSPFNQIKAVAHMRNSWYGELHQKTYELPIWLAGWRGIDQRQPLPLNNAWGYPLVFSASDLLEKNNSSNAWVMSIKKTCRGFSDFRLGFSYDFQPSPCFWFRASASELFVLKIPRWWHQRSSLMMHGG